MLKYVHLMGPSLCDHITFSAIVYMLKKKIKLDQQLKQQKYGIEYGCYLFSSIHQAEMLFNSL